MAAIAREAGVGKTTVSLALRNDVRLKRETRDHVQAVARRMGYQANAVVANLMAQLRAGRDPKYQATIGILNATPHRDGLRTLATFQAWTEGMRRRCAELGYGTDEFWIHDANVSPARLRQTLVARNIRGAVIAGVVQHRRIPPQFDTLWDELACVMVGLRPERPALNFASNDQFSTALHAARELALLGYSRPGLVIAPEVDDDVDHRFSAGIAAGWLGTGAESIVPGFDFQPTGRAAFQAWFKKHLPDVIICLHREIREWLEELGLKIPRDVGLVHLDLGPDTSGWSGMNQNNEHVGSFAIDLVIGQLHRNEVGLPERPKCMMTESQWVAGKTVRRRKKTLTRPD